MAGVGARPRRSAVGQGSARDPQIKRYEKWKDIASLSGPPGIRLIKGFHDEALLGEWRGFRSSRLGDRWRVIYRVVSDELAYYVESITPHDYRRR